MRIPHALLAADRVDQLLHRIGVPRYLWHSQINEVKFRSTQLWGASFGTLSQRQLVLKYLSDAERTIQKPPQLSPKFTAVVGSDPTGTGAQHLCAAITRRLVQAKLQQRDKEAKSLQKVEVLFLDLMDWVKPKERSLREPDLVVAWNLGSASAEELLSRARNLIYFYRSSAIFLAVAGVVEVEKWCRTHLRYLPDVVLSVRDLDLGATLAEPAPRKSG